MSRSRPARVARPAAAPADPLLARLRRALHGGKHEEPLPTTRELGRKFGVANTTVYRLLRNLADSGEIWQHPTNGRYYQAGARALLDRPKPVACLIRRLELGSELYRELLEGVSAGCGERQRTMLLWHDELLVNHPDAQEPPRFASESQQRDILRDFVQRHGESANGYVLDHVWSDAALATQAESLRPAVVLVRTSELPEVSNVALNFHAGAIKAVAHLLGRGFQQIIPIVPFTGDPAIEEFSTALKAATVELGCRELLTAPVSASTPGERNALMQKMRRTRGRAALLCPEDNIAGMLYAVIKAAGVPCPTQVGVLSVMGTDLAARAGLSCVRYDFRALGRQAIAALTSRTPVRQRIEPTFVQGVST